MKGLDGKLSQEDINYVAQKSEGYSGSDLEILCKEAAMEPLRYAQNTNHFKKVMVNGQRKFLPVDSNGDF